MSDFDYVNVETKMVGGVKTVRRVTVKNGKGYKLITKYSGGKKLSTVKKTISEKHLEKIRAGKFVSGLFKDCVNCNKTRKIRK